MHSDPIPGLLATDVQQCRALLRRGSRSFSAAARLLPRRTRDAIAAIYAFCRTADDLVDGGGASRWTLIHLRQRLDGIYGAPAVLDPTDRALAAVVRHYAIPRAVFDALLEGFAWELDGRRYDRIEDVRAYGMRVAGTVGLAVAHVIGPRDPETLARACDLGVAMQLTNIARDVGEDAAVGRLSLPREWMREAGIDPGAWLRQPRHSAGLGTVVRRLLAEADRLYVRAEPGIDRLPRRTRWAIRAARLIYADIGRVVARRGYDSVSKRAFTSGRRKVWLALRAIRPLGSVSDTANWVLDEAWDLVLRCGDWNRMSLPHQTTPESDRRTQPWQIQEETA
jgi:phytoene synthase